MIYAVGAGAVSPLGAGWRGLGTRVLAGERGAGAVAEIVDEDARQKKMMSRAARLAAAAMRQALDDAGWPREERGAIGAFCGVGASGGEMDELQALIQEGLGAVNPLLAFRLMNNFTLCHGAIAAGLGGPSGAYFSRGPGTASALRAAVRALEDGDCARALVGGADSALHPVTQAELAREGRLGDWAEGAAMIALTSSPDGALAVLDRGTAELTLDGRLADSLAATPALAWAAAIDLIASGTARRVGAGGVVWSAL
jgi:3-oxoacyl-[acyl-carrier-protein] synthase II